MLKDLFKPKKEKTIKDNLNVSIADGYVDIKGYKVNSDGTKELVYHDTGDNVVTDWMRHAIISHDRYCLISSASGPGPLGNNAYHLTFIVLPFPTSNTIEMRKMSMDSESSDEIDNPSHSEVFNRFQKSSEPILDLRLRIPGRFC